MPTSTSGRLVSRTDRQRTDPVSPRIISSYLRVTTVVHQWQMSNSCIHKNIPPSYHFRGHRAGIFEGVHGIPYVVRCLEAVPAATTCDVTICLTDFMVIIAEIPSTHSPENTGAYTISTVPLFTGNTAVGDSQRTAAVQQSITAMFSIW